MSTTAQHSEASDLKLSHDQLSDDELMLYARQILLEGWGIGAQEKLRASTAIIIGAGGLGCPVSETLARAGVGHIYLIDNDVIELSNLQRQTLFKPEDVGRYKAETAAETLKRINPFIHIDYKVERLLPDNIDDIIRLLMSELTGSSVGADGSAKDNAGSSTDKNANILLLDCTDNFAIRELLNQVSVNYNIALLSASAIAMSGQLALYEPSKKTGCYHCVFGDVLSNRSDGRTEEQTCVSSGVLASTTSVMGNFQANAALYYLGLGHNPLAGQLLTWDARSMTQYNIRYRQNKNCRVCG